MGMNDPYYAPSKVQLYSTVKGDDRYEPRRSVWPALVGLFLVAAGVYGLILLFAEMF